MDQKTPDERLLPLRRVSDLVFCPRLFWLKHCSGDDEQNHHTIEGSDIHRNVDVPGGSMEPPDGDDGPSWHTRSLWLSDRELGITGKVDLVEVADGGEVKPVDYKKGKPNPDGNVWNNHRVQLTLQALLLEAQGYACSSIEAWYDGAKKRVGQQLSGDIRDEAKEVVSRAFTIAGEEHPPHPLDNSPKCNGCSLSPICLPEEVNALNRDHLAVGASDQNDDESIRRVVPPRDDAVPVYVETQGAYVGKSGHCLKIKIPKKDSDNSDAENQEIGLGRVSQVNLFGNIQVSTQAMQTCLRQDIPVLFFSSNGWFYGQTQASSSRQVHRRVAQFEAPSARKLAIARTIVADKIHNQRTLIRRNAESKSVKILDQLTRLRNKTEKANEPDTLLGYEGTAGRHYWEGFSRIVGQTEEDREGFEMTGRTRRPPEDPVNALLSYGYALLVKDCTLAVKNVGLDPYIGVYHTVHHGRPSMALDLMEIFRPLVVDSCVMRIIRRGDVKPKHFEETGQAVSMKSKAKRALIRAYERRMDGLVTHPTFGYQISYRQILFVHARLFARVLTGELDECPSFRTR